MYSEHQHFGDIVTSLRHINYTCMLVDSHPKHLPGEELGVPGPAEVQLVEGPALQLVVVSEERAARLLRADGAVQDHHEQDYRGHAGRDQTRMASFGGQHQGALCRLLLCQLTQEVCGQVKEGRTLPVGLLKVP